MAGEGGGSCQGLIDKILLSNHRIGNTGKGKRLDTREHIDCSIFVYPLVHGTMEVEKVGTGTMVLWCRTVGMSMFPVV